MNQSSRKTKDFNRPTMRIFLDYFKPHMGLFVLDLSCALIASAVDLIFPLVARHAMYTMLPNKAFEAFFHVMIIVAVVALAWLSMRRDARRGCSGCCAQCQAARCDARRER